MDELILVRPSKPYANDVMEYRKEYIDYDEIRIDGSSGLLYYNSFDEWLAETCSIEKEKLSREKVNASTFLSIRKLDNKIIGTIQLRHSLTEELERYGGHIGYGIRPTERQKGYGTKQLSLLLNIAKQMKMTRVMISCDSDNIGSAKVIKNNGGILEWEGIYQPTGDEIQIYWIALS